MWNKIVIFFELMYNVLTLGKKEIKPKVVYLILFDEDQYKKWSNYITTLPRGTYFKYVPGNDAPESIFNIHIDDVQKTYIVYANVESVISFQQHLRSIFPTIETIIPVETTTKRILLTCILEPFYSSYESLVYVKESFKLKEPNKLLTLIKATEDFNESNLEDDINIWQSWNPVEFKSLESVH
jgi:hypothetical protein